MIFQKRNSLSLALLIVIILLSSCSPGQENGEPEIPAETVSPTPTEAPLAARVNGEGILLVEYESELKRYQAGIEQLGEQFDSVLAKQEVLDYLITQTLFAQGAAAQGYFVDEVELQERIDGFAESSGGQDTLQTWIEENYYDE